MIRNKYLERIRAEITPEAGKRYDKILDELGFDGLVDYRDAWLDL